MRKIKSIICIVATILIVGCENDLGNDTDEVIAKEPESVELTQNFRMLDWTPNIYHDYFANAENEVGISSLKGKPFLEESIVSYMDSKLAAKSGFVYKINGKQMSSSKGNFDLSGLYGTDVRFTIEKKEGATFKDGSTSKNVDMYIPHLVSITKPEILNESEQLPHCYSKDLVLEWNEDPKNEEGLIIAAEYIGISANPNKDKNEHIINTDFIENDNGKWVIEDDLWKGIPDTGIVHLVLLRGNVDLSEIDGELNKFFAESHAIVSIILIRDIASVIK